MRTVCLHVEAGIRTIQLYYYISVSFTCVSLQSCKYNCNKCTTKKGLSLKQNQFISKCHFIVQIWKGLTVDSAKYSLFFGEKVELIYKNY